MATELEIFQKERDRSGTTWTRNEEFDKKGFLVIKDLWDPEELYHPCPSERGQIDYLGSIDQFVSQPEESQVSGSLARTMHPQYKKVWNGVRRKIERIIGKKLYNTYYYERFYFGEQQLNKHQDRDACEISVSMHISTNLPDPEKNWPLWIKATDTYVDEQKSAILVPGKTYSLVLEPGDGVLYKGCERPHWREQFPTVQRKRFNLFNMKDHGEYYYHQIFFHYVLQDGVRSHHAYDRVAINTSLSGL